MKKVKLILPLMTAMLLLFSGIRTEAATTAKEYAAGTTSASLTLSVKNMQSFDGKVSVSSETKGQKITLGTMSVKSSNSANTVINEISKEKVYVVTNGAAVTATLTIPVKFSGDGKYQVKLTGNYTDQNGDYQEGKIDESIKITVGTSTASSDDDEEDDKKDTTESTTTETTTESTTTETTTDSTTKTETTNSVPSIKKESAEKEMDVTTARNKETAEEKAEERLIDEILQEEMKVELEEAETELEEESLKKKGDIGGYLRFLLPIILIMLLLLIPLLFWLWKLKKGSTADYDGAPMVDYNIEEDDE